MHVRDIMTTRVFAVRPETPLEEVAWVLDEHGISGVPVVDDEGVVIGVVTKADIERRLGPQKRAARTAAAAMSVAPRTLTGSDTLAAAAAAMLDAGITRLPVVDADGRLVGIVTRADLLRGLTFRVAAVTSLDSRVAPRRRIG